MKTKPNYVMLMVLALLMATTTGFAQKSKKNADVDVASNQA
ncbi:MAG: hypothetical protein RL222_1960, partial [Bacteroidota bacterium]